MFYGDGDPMILTIGTSRNLLTTAESRPFLSKVELSSDNLNS